MLRKDIGYIINRAKANRRGATAKTTKLKRCTLYYAGEVVRKNTGFDNHFDTDVNIYLTILLSIVYNLN